MKETFAGRMVRIHVGENDRWQGKPLYEALVAKCKDLEISEVAVSHGVEGCSAAGPASFAGYSTAVRGVPVQICIVDTEDKIARLLPFLDAMVEEGVVATTRAEVVRYRRPNPPRSRGNLPPTSNRSLR